jgi:hypothetical protein
MTHQVRYCLTESTYSNPDIGTYIGYGIAVPGICSVKDVFVRRTRAEEVSALLNRARLSPLHLKDVLEDLLP